MENGFSNKPSGISLAWSIPESLPSLLPRWWWVGYKRGAAVRTNPGTFSTVGGSSEYLLYRGIRNL